MRLQNRVMYVSIDGGGRNLTYGTVQKTRKMRAMSIKPNEESIIFLSFLCTERAVRTVFLVICRRAEEGLKSLVVVHLLLKPLS